MNNGHVEIIAPVGQTPQWLLHRIPWKFNEQNTACIQGNKVNKVKISPCMTMAFQRGRGNPTTMEVPMQVVFGSPGHPKPGSYTVIMFQNATKNDSSKFQFLENQVTHMQLATRLALSHTSHRKPVFMSTPFFRNLLKLL